mmetsp:Transcript_15050/g.35640  ORF Transcript_15050/g.35640 Transcript_15050/m.35640 type:complete len:285 (-) Transcript_15050:548-1402(-)
MPERRVEQQSAALPPRVRRQWQAAAATERPGDGTLGLAGQQGRRMVQLQQGLAQRSGVGADLQTQRPLPRARQHLLDLEDAAHALPQAQALETGSGQHDGVVAALIELAQPGIEVAAQRLDAQVRPQVQQLRHAAQAGAADDGALGKLGERRIVVRDEGVARVFALQHGGEHEALRQLHRHVLQRVHRELGAPFGQGGLELLDEQALAADLGERAVENLVAARRHAQQRGRQAQFAGKAGLHMLGLPERQAAFARRDGDGGGHARIIEAAPAPSAGLRHAGAGS